MLRVGRKSSVAAAFVALGLLSLPRAAAAFVWPNVPERIEKGLGSSDPAERRVAAAQIASLPREFAKPLLVRALADSDNEVRVSAAKASAKVKLEGASDLVADWLTESDARLRLAACEVIRAAPTEKSVTALGRVLSDPSQDVRAAAAQAMGRSGSADAVSLLLGHLDDTSPEVRSEVVIALGRLGDARAVLPLVGKVQDGAIEVRKRVARALGDLRDARATSALVLSLADASLDVRVEAALALGRIGSDEGAVALAPLAQTAAGSGTRGAPPASEASLALRQAALRALGRIGSPRAIEVVIVALEHDRPEAGRSPAREALVAMGAKAQKPLQTLLSGSPSERAAIGATQALAAVGDQSAVPAIVRAMQRGKVPAPAALAALASLKSDAALPPVLELIGDSSPEVRRAAVAAAIALIDPASPDGRAVDPVRDALADHTLPNEERVGLLDLLGRTGAPRATDLLLPYADSKSPALRRAALRALGSLTAGGAAADAKLEQALGDELGTVRMDAAVALSKVGASTLAPKLLKRLLRSAEQDRAALGVALAGVLSRSKDSATVNAVADAVAAAPNSARDALIEGLGRADTDVTLKRLADLAAGAEDDRRKVAEVATARGSASRALLLSLAKDPDSGVRANAAWGLGFVLEKQDASAIAALLADADVNVAGNAAASLGRLAMRAGDAALADGLCKVLSDSRPYVRANALAGLHLAGGRCDASLLSALLASDSSELVRATAAAILHTIASSPAAPPASAPALPSVSGAKPAKPPLDPSVVAKKALERCASEEPTFRVAQRCDRQQKSHAGQKTFPLTVFVVPDGASQPVARAPFALELADGTYRLGIADRRGVVFEGFAPQGPVQLAVPAALLRSP